MNPDHMFVGTHYENMHDMINKGRNSTVKLTVEKVIKIRTLYVPRSKVFGVSSLSKRFNISKTQLRRILSNEDWKHDQRRIF